MWLKNLSNSNLFSPVLQCAKHNWVIISAAQALSYKILWFPLTPIPFKAVKMFPRTRKMVIKWNHFDLLKHDLWCFNFYQVSVLLSHRFKKKWVSWSLVSHFVLQFIYCSYLWKWICNCYTLHIHIVGNECVVYESWISKASVEHSTTIDYICGFLHNSLSIITPNNLASCNVI